MTEGERTEPLYFRGMVKLIEDKMGGNVEYQKNYDDIYNLLDRADGVNTAIRHAKRRMSEYDSEKDKPSEYDPGTTVYKLVEELKRYLDE